MKIILPKRYVSDDEIGGNPLFFLAGPIRGGGEWQHLMCNAIWQYNRNAWIACPCRWNYVHPLATYFATGDESRFKRQLEWEQYYLKRAGISTSRQPGCVLFWLGCEDAKNPHPGPEPYAMDTRGELGEWRMRMQFQGARVVVGGHPEFHGLSQIQRNFTEVLGYAFTIHPSMDATARAAIEEAAGNEVELET